MAERVAWYEQVVLMRKIHALEFDTTRRPEAEAIRQRQAEAVRLLEQLGPLVESAEPGGSNANLADVVFTLQVAGGVCRTG